MKTTLKVRQGDVFVERVEEMGTGTPVKAEHGRIILAHGEATGHHHSLPAVDVADPILDVENGAIFLRLIRDSVLSHQEHAPINLEAGIYRVTRQREYSPEAIRNVAD